MMMTDPMTMYSSFAGMVVMSMFLVMCIGSVMYMGKKKDDDDDDKKKNAQDIIKHFSEILETTPEFGSEDGSYPGLTYNNMRVVSGFTENTTNGCGGVKTQVTDNTSPPLDMTADKCRTHAQEKQCYGFTYDPWTKTCKTLGDNFLSDDLRQDALEVSFGSKWGVWLPPNAPQRTRDEYKSMKDYWS